ncbi:MAG: hypothetical protein ABIE94_01315 [archaeon]
MKSLRNFQEFLKSGIVEKRTPDFLRAKSLVEEATKRKSFIEKMAAKLGVSDEDANYFVENSYDVLIGLLRAKLLSVGFTASGKGAHEAEVSYMRELTFSEADVRFMNSLRYFRNGILYYGERFDSEYAKKVLNFLEKMYPLLKKMVK